MSRVGEGNAVHDSCSLGRHLPCGSGENTSVSHTTRKRLARTTVFILFISYIKVWRKSKACIMVVLETKLNLH